jgi:hypothetical protein
MEYQICKICGENKEVSAFAKGSNTRNGITKIYYHKTCKLCDKPRTSKKNSTYKQKNRKLLADKQKSYYQDHKDESSLYHKNLYMSNKDTIKQRVKSNIYLRRQSDPIFKLKESISSNIRLAINKNGNSIFKYLPYTIQELKDHLEKQFEPWMNWNNQGIYKLDTWDDNDQSTWVWNVDHIIPHSRFQYSSMEDQEFIDCWSLNNLRPYSAKQNVIDNNRK